MHFNDPYDNLYDDEDLMDQLIKCEVCNSHNLICTECGNIWDYCSCITDNIPDLICMGCSTIFSIDELIKNENEMTTSTSTSNNAYCSCIPQAKYFCGKCGVTRSGLNETWKKTNQVTSTTTKAPNSFPPGGKTTKNSSAAAFSPDRHYGVDIDLGNGVIVHPSSMNNERNKDGKSQVIPDFGLYADYGWRPTWRNEMINWPDYGIPKNYEVAAAQIVDAYNRAVEGEYVEFGCIGGHGRTGTILGCMKILAERTSENASFTYTDAITWVRTKYCDHAIESEMQEWFIGWFDHYQYGTDLPQKPEPKPKSYGGWDSSFDSCSKAAHYAMHKAGYTTCAKNPTSCKWWKQDIAEFNDPAKDQSGLEKSTAYDVEKYAKKLLEDNDSNDLDFSACEFEAHYAMWKNGYSNCAELGNKCEYWDKDLAEFKSGKINMLEDEFITKYMLLYPPRKTTNNRKRNRKRNRRNGRR